ncbi:MAG: amidohydrolase [candidate division Zixibacteria bacterium]
MNRKNCLSKLRLIGPIIFAAILLILNSCGTSPEIADLVLLNGKIVTVDENNPQVEAVAAKGDKIIAIGKSRDIQAYVGSYTQTIDLEGKLVIPGFIEGHGHFMGLGRSRMKLRLAEAKNWNEIVEMVRKAVDEAQPGEWILGRGWHQDKWDEIPNPNVNGLPYHTELSEVSPDNRVLLEHASGHSVIANAKALELAGIDRNTPDPKGGEIVRDAKGNPIGVFRETAEDLIYDPYKGYYDNRSEEEIEAERLKAVQLAVEECLANGVTGFHDAGVTFRTIDFYKELIDRGILNIRINAMIGEKYDSLIGCLGDYKIIGYGNNHLTVRSIKRVIDGALGSHGAWLLEPYIDIPTSTGLNTETIEDMRETARLAVENGFQLCTHAIGDRGNRETLDIYEGAIAGGKDLRWRIEHAQHLHPDDIPRFGQLGVIASMQGIHCTSDGPWVNKRLDDKRIEEGAYVWRTLINSGAKIVNGTDTPVENVNPLECFYASVTRKLPDGSLFYPDQKMTREEALKSYTINAAYASYDEDIKGSITPGKLADMVVLSNDIMTVQEDEISNCEVLYTIVGGKILYKK